MWGIASIEHTAVSKKHLHSIGDVIEQEIVLGIVHTPFVYIISQYM